MELKDKKLLYKDLCSRLPYHPIVEIANDDWEGCKQGVFNNLMGFHHLEAFLYDRIELVPYLRPMSSMTEEEAIKYVTLTHYNVDDDGKPYRELTVEAIDWLNERHFDYRGLIPMGLAIEATEGMYKTK